MIPYYKAGTTNNTVVKSFPGQFGTSPAALVKPPPLPTRPPPLRSPAVSAPRDQPFSSAPSPVGFPVPLVVITPINPSNIFSNRSNLPSCTGGILFPNIPMAHSSCRVLCHFLITFNFRQKLVGCFMLQNFSTKLGLSPLHR